MNKLGRNEEKLAPASEFMRRNSDASAAGFADRTKVLLERGGGLSVLAKKAGISPRVLGKYRDGEADPTRERLVSLAHAGGVSVEWLATGDGPMEPRALNQDPVAEPESREADLLLDELGELDPRRLIVVLERESRAAENRSVALSRIGDALRLQAEAWKTQAEAVKLQAEAVKEAEASGRLRALMLRSDLLSSDPEAYEIARQGMEGLEQVLRREREEAARQQSRAQQGDRPHDESPSPGPSRGNR